VTAQRAAAAVLPVRRGSPVFPVVLVLAILPAGGCGEPARRLDLEKLELPAPEELPAAARESTEPIRDRLAVLAADPDTEASELATGLGRLGMAYHAHGLERPALACFGEAAELDPDQPRWPYYAGYLRQQAGELEAAAAALDAAHALDPEAPWTLLRLADVELDRGRTRRAAELYRRALGHQAAAAAAHYGLGRVALAAGEAAAAIEEFEAVLATAPEATRVHHLLAQAFRAAGREEDARQALASAGPGELPLADPILAELLREAGGSQTHVERAQRASKAGDTGVAERELRAALEANPDDPTARFNLAVLLARHDRADEAEEQYRTLLAQDPDQTAARFNLGGLLAGQGRMEEAVAELERVVATVPDFKEARFNLAGALSRLGRWSEAAEQLAALRRIDPGFRDAGLLEAAALLDAGRTEEALERLDALVAADPDNARLLLRRAEALAAAGRWAEARASLERELTRRPTSGELTHGLARLLATAADPGVRNPARAVELASTIYRSRPLPMHAETLALALAAAGRREQAIELLDRALAAGAGGAPDSEALARLDRLRRELREGTG